MAFSAKPRLQRPCAIGAADAMQPRTGFAASPPSRRSRLYHAFFFVYFAKDTGQGTLGEYCQCGNVANTNVANFQLGDWKLG